MDRYAAGDDAAFSELYDALAPRLLRYLRRQTRDAARAEDLLQETLLQIHRHRARFFRGAEVTPWAFAIARRFLIDGIRKDKRGHILESALQNLPGNAPPGSDDLVASAQLGATLEGEIARLPPKQRLAFEMVKKDGLSLREAAQVLGININTLKLRIHRSYAKLHAVIAGATKDGSNR